MRISDWSSDVCSSDLPLFLHVLRLRQSRGLSGPQQFQSLAQHGCACLRLLVALLPFLDKIGHSLIKALKVREHQLRFDGLRISDGIDLAFDMGDVIIDEAAEHMRSEEHTSELQSLMSNAYAVVCLKKKNMTTTHKL